jgi:hypothetical protein
LTDGRLTSRNFISVKTLYNKYQPDSKFSKLRGSSYPHSTNWLDCFADPDLARDVLRQPLSQGNRTNALAADTGRTHERFEAESEMHRSPGAHS